MVDGEGIRYAIFVQGCKHYCPGCHNPETWDMKSGKLKSVDTIVTAIRKKKHIDGITLSGGDPMYQAKACVELAKKLKEFDYNIWCYTGFTYEEIIDGEDEAMKELLKYIDVLVDGPFIESKKSLEVPFKGSSNQRIIHLVNGKKEGESA